MKVVCCKCGVSIKRIVGRFGRVSHSYCSKCLKEAYRELGKLKPCYESFK